MECSGLNENGPHRLIGTGNIRRCGFVGGSVSLGVGFVISEAQSRSSDSLFLFSADLDIELSATSPAACLPVCRHASRCDDNEPNL